MLIILWYPVYVFLILLSSAGLSNNDLKSEGDKHSLESSFLVIIIFIHILILSFHLLHSLLIGFQREEAEANRWKDVMAGNLGEWGKAEEKRDSDKRDLTQLVNIDGVQMLWPGKLFDDKTTY